MKSMKSKVQSKLIIVQAFTCKVFEVLKTE